MTFLSCFINSKIEWIDKFDTSIWNSFWIMILMIERKAIREKKVNDFTLKSVVAHNFAQCLKCNSNVTTFDAFFRFWSCVTWIAFKRLLSSHSCWKQKENNLDCQFHSRFSKFLDVILLHDVIQLSFDKFNRSILHHVRWESKLQVIIKIIIKVTRIEITNYNKKYDENHCQKLDWEQWIKLY